MTNKTTEPAALAGIKPVFEMGFGWLDTENIYPNGYLLYSAATVEHLQAERDAERDNCVNIIAAYQEERSALLRAVDTDYEQLYREAQEQLAAMTQERDDFEQARDYFDKMNVMHFNQLAASQAREQQLREALEKYCRYYSTNGRRCSYCNCLRDDGHNKDCAIGKALLLPQDDTALKAWGAKLLREWVAKIMSHGCTWAVTNMNLKADELERGENRNG